MKLAAALVGLASAEWNNPAAGQRLCQTYKFTAVADFSVGAGALSGQLTFTQEGCGKDFGVDMSGTLTWADGHKTAGTVQHGWHVHQWGNTVNGCGPDFTGGHFNPFHAEGGE